jgi:3-phenylpropionate/trans-cinnamate dioxygenase ferredoxin reductase subunit
LLGQDRPRVGQSVPTSKWLCGEIHVVSNEDQVFYERPPLSKQVLSKEASYESLNLFSAEQVQEFNIQWHKPAVATKVDRRHKQVI